MRDSEGESDGSEETSSDSDGGHRLPFARFSIARGGAICCSRYLQERENVGFAQPPHAVAAAY